MCIRDRSDIARAEVVAIVERRPGIGLPEAHVAVIDAGEYLSLIHISEPTRPY